MTIFKLEKAEWFDFFGRMSPLFIGKRAEIEISALKLGSQIEVEWLPLFGVVYHPDDDLIEIALDGLDHRIYTPRELYVDVGPLGLLSFAVIDAGGVQQIIKLGDLPALPSPPTPS